MYEAQKRQDDQGNLMTLLDSIHENSEFSTTTSYKRLRSDLKSIFVDKHQSNLDLLRKNPNDNNV